MKTQLLNSMKNEAVNYVMRTYSSQVIDAVKSRYGFSINVEHFEKPITLANEMGVSRQYIHSVLNTAALSKKMAKKINTTIEEIINKRGKHEENYWQLHEVVV